MKRRWIIAAFLVVFLLGNICGYAVESNSETVNASLSPTESATASPIVATKPKNNSSSAPVRASAQMEMQTTAATPTPKVTTVPTVEPTERSVFDAKATHDEQVDLMDNPLMIAIRINSQDRKLVPDAKKHVRFGGEVKVEGNLGNESVVLELCIGVSEEEKGNVRLLDTAFTEKSEGELVFEVNSFSLEPYMQGKKLPDSLALFVGNGDSIEYVMNLPIDTNYRVVICGLIFGACSIATTLCIVLLIRTNRKLQKEKYRLLDMQTRKSQRTVRNEN